MLKSHVVPLINSLRTLGSAECDEPFFAEVNGNNLHNLQNLPVSHECIWAAIQKG